MYVQFTSCAYGVKQLNFGIYKQTNTKHRKALTTLLWVYPVDTGRKLSVYKTFRRHPGRLLDVLRTFNLRPVSAGYAETMKKLWWNTRELFSIITCSEAATRDVLYEKVLLEISQNSQENTWTRVSFLIKLQAEVCNFINKRGSGTACEFWKIPKNTFFYRTLWATASDYFSVQLAQIHKFDAKFIISTTDVENIFTYSLQLKHDRFPGLSVRKIASKSFLTSFLSY